MRIAQPAINYWDKSKLPDQKSKHPAMAKTTIESEDNSVEAPPQALSVQSGSQSAAKKSPPWESSVENYIDTLKTQYTHVQFNVSTGLNDDNIKELITALGDGKHLVLSDEFLAKMATSEQDFNAGKSLIEKLLAKYFSKTAIAANNTGIAVNSPDKIFLWQQKQPLPAQNPYLDLLKDSVAKSYREKNGSYVTEIKTKQGTLRFSYTKRLNYGSGKDLARLANIKKQGTVHSFISGMRGYINRVRSDHSVSPKEAQYAIAKMNGVIRCAKAKIKQLNEEDGIESRSHRNVKNNNLDRAAALLKYLRQKQLERKAREYAQIVKDPTAYLDLFMREKESNYIDLMSSAPLSADMTSAASGNTADVSTPAAEIAITTGSIDILT